ncbi:MAG TPA: hypothetical protein VFG95_03410 [Nitrospiria bacterium]|nr:hypothetical protein [Nitrospiria bacterium]
MNRRRLCGLLLLFYFLMSPIYSMAQEVEAPAEQAAPASPPSQPAPEPSEVPQAETPPPTETPSPSTVQPTPESAAPSEAVPPSEEAAAPSAERAPPPSSEAKKAVPPSPEEAYKAYFKRGTIRFGGSSNLMGSITQFHKTATESERLNISPSIGYFFLDNWEVDLIASIDYLGFTDVKGNVSHGTEYSVLVGPAYYFNFGKIIVPYVGGALGYGHIDAILATDPALSTSSPQTSSSGIVGQLYAGMKFLVSPTWSLDLTVTYQGWGGDFDRDQFFGAMGFSIYLK